MVYDAGNMTETQNSNTFLCLDCYGTQCLKPLNCSTSVKCFASTTTDSDGFIAPTRGCINAPERIYLMCTSFGSHLGGSYNVSCCTGQFCNNGKLAGLESSVQTWSIIVGSLSFFVLLGLLFAMYIYFCKYRWARNGLMYFSKMPSVNRCKHEFDTLKHKGDFDEESTLPGYCEDSLSGSGSGLPLLIQRTLSKNISLDEIIGQGKYGRVFRGVWQGDFVAVKIFFSKDEASWSRETEIYNTVMLRHENILGYLGSDVTSVVSCTQLWLVTDLHELGSLHDYLLDNEIDYESLFKFALGTINGLVHLHTHITGTQGKPAIAHRDIKTKNILVKSDGMCCIADLGLAVIEMASTGVVDFGNNPRAGTKRYMSPEFLDETFNFEVFESYRNADIYSMGLVLWEIMSRCRTGDIPVPEYQLPYENWVPSDPSFEDMKKVVCTDERRPLIAEAWHQDQILLPLSHVMQECWRTNPRARLTSLRIKKNVMKIAIENLGAKWDRYG